VLSVSREIPGVLSIGKKPVWLPILVARIVPDSSFLPDGEAFCRMVAGRPGQV
jgi:hypothetical protein